MAFDGMFLRQVTRQLQAVVLSRINKIYQISDTEVLFQLRGHEKQQLMVSCHSTYNRIHLTDRDYPTRANPNNFIMLLRKYLEGGTIMSLKQASLDRYLIMEVSNRNELGDRITLEVYVELMGKYANLILVYEGKIITALKNIPPFENTRRTVLPGAMFKPTDPQTGKLNPLEVSEVEESENMFERFIGFSPLLSTEFAYRLHQGQKYTDIINELTSSSNIYIYEKGHDTLFHCLPLTHLQLEPQIMEICAGLDYLYFAREERERIRQQTGDLFKFIRREIKKTQQKTARLEEALEEALDCDKWRNFGDVLYANPGIDTKGHSELVLKDYEGNDITVPLDPKLDLKGNARKCFQKYRKGATGQKYIQEQLDITRENMNYFTLLQQQLEMADFNTAREIRTELETNGFMRKSRQKVKKKNVGEPAYLKIELNGRFIYVGKNNIQNEYITFKKAGRADTWFHVKDMHGAHVVITTSHPSEQEIRLCASLAAYYSRGRNSSSIPVNYTLVRNLKKIPGSKTGLVSMKEYQTIYIDIDEEQLKKYL